MQDRFMPGQTSQQCLDKALVFFRHHCYLRDLPSPLSPSWLCSVQVVSFKGSRGSNAVSVSSCLLMYLCHFLRFSLSPHCQAHHALGYFLYWICQNTYVGPQNAVVQFHYHLTRSCHHLGDCQHAISDTVTCVLSDEMLNFMFLSFPGHCMFKKTRTFQSQLQNIRSAPSI